MALPAINESKLCQCCLPLEHELHMLRPDAIRNLHVTITIWTDCECPELKSGSASSKLNMSPLKPHPVLHSVAQDHELQVSLTWQIAHNVIIYQYANISEQLLYAWSGCK